MGIINVLFREIRAQLKGILKSISKLFKKKLHDTPTVIPKSWQTKTPVKSGKETEKAPGYVKHRFKVPHLLTFKRILAGFLLLINFIFSQFLLGTVGTGAQPMFILFLLNCFILIDYLWKTRKNAE